jgi:carboxyl-terminal processing protease
MKFHKSFLLLALVLILPFALPRSAASAENGKNGESAEKGSFPSKDDDYELYKLLLDTVDQVDQNYVKPIDRRELIEAAIRGLMTKLDPYSAYIGPDELAQFRSSVDNEFGGIGIHVSAEDGDLKVLSPIYGSPAYRAGIQAGDRIVEIDGKSTVGIQPDDAVRWLQGAEGTKVLITVVHAGKTNREKYALARERVHVETVLGDRRKSDDHWEFMYDEKSQIGYVRISSFSQETAKELRTALEDLKQRKVRGLVLDLRFNPGGLLRSAIEVSDLFISAGRIVSTKGRNTPERVWDAQGNAVFEDIPLVVLVNHYSASASEIVSACLQDHKRAVIMGERTWGKGSVQNIIALEDGRSALKLTTAAYQRPSGKNIHRFPDSKDKDEWGVMPDLGYELGLDARETRELLADRRNRDIIAAHATGEKSATAPAAPARLSDKPAVVPPESPASQRPGIEDKSAPDPWDYYKSPVSQGPAVEEEPLPGPTKFFGVARGKPATQAESKPVASKPFIDRQLEMAVKYLRDALAKKKDKP